MPDISIPLAALGIGAVRPPALRQVATRTIMPFLNSASNKQQMNTRGNFLRDTVSALAFIVPNFFVDTYNNISGSGSSEVGTGAAGSCTAAVEWPAGGGGPVPITFSGARTGVMADKSFVVSDLTQLPTPILSGSLIKSHVWSAHPGANGICYANTMPTFTGLGDGFEFGATTTDKTLTGGAVAGAGSGAGQGPIAILAMTSRGVLTLVGDSRLPGVKDTGDLTGDTGEIARGIGANYPYHNLGVPSDKLSNFVTGTGATNRQALLQYGTHCILEYGINDLGGGRSAAQLEADMQTFLGLWGTSRQAPWACTLPPVSTSTDSFVTTANQTTNATYNTQRVIHNNAVRGGLAGFSGYIELADVVESARDSGLWGVSSGAAITADGIHENARGNKLLQASGAVTRGIGFVQ